MNEDETKDPFLDEEEVIPGVDSEEVDEPADDGVMWDEEE